MSVWKDKRSPYYQYDFTVGGHRYFGSTKRTNERAAKAVEGELREKAKKTQAATRTASTSLRINDVAVRYWREVGQYHAGSDNTWRDLVRLTEYFGKDKIITEIDDDAVTKLVAWRRGHRVVRRRKPLPKDAPPPPPGPLISNATVNRSTTEVLKKLFTRAKAWGVRFDREPEWKRHWLDEPEERVRELVGDEGRRLDAAMRDDYAPFFTFAALSGLRLHECLLTWDQVDWEARRIRRKGKGGRLVTTAITSAVREVLWPLRGQHEIHVFTYVATSTRKGGTATTGQRIRDQRYPITYSGAKTQWKRLRNLAGVKDFRFHDFRHDVGTKLLRETRNLKLVQRALNHSRITTTAKYAHVLDHEVADGLEQLHESRTKSRSATRKAS